MFSLQVGWVGFVGWKPHRGTRIERERERKREREKERS